METGSHLQEAISQIRICFDAMRWGQCLETKQPHGTCATDRTAMQCVIQYVAYNRTRSGFPAPNQFDDVLVDREYDPPTQLCRTRQRTPHCQIRFGARKNKRRTTSRASRGVVPVQNRRMPSSVKIRYAQWNEFRYAWRASRLCIRVLMTLPTFRMCESQRLSRRQQLEKRTRAASSYTR